MQETVPDARAQAEFWEGLAAEEKNRLRRTAAVMLGCEECAETVLNEARAETRLAEVPAEFASSFAMRVVARLAICRCQQAGRSCEAGRAVETPLTRLPWAERAAFVLRETLAYSRRDAALLLGMTDRQVDQLLVMARQRGATPDGSGIDTGSANPERELSAPAASSVAKQGAPQARGAGAHRLRVRHLPLRRSSRAY